MKILQLISSKGYFGAENVLVQLANELNKRDDCQIVGGVIKNLSNPHDEVAVECQARGIEAICFPCVGKFDFNTLSLLRQYAKNRRIDVIHSHGYKSNLYSFFATLNLPVALVATCHNWVGDAPKMKFYAALDRFFLKQFSHVAAVSLEVKNKIVLSKIPEANVNLVLNGVDVERFADCNLSSQAKEKLGIPGNQIVIGTVGRISSEKGHIHLCNAFKSLHRQFPETSLLIVGDGDLREELQIKFRDPSIIFTGLRNDIPKLYQCMDIFALPSLTEGLPMVLLEAMSSRLPVVATKVGYVPQVILENQTGLLVEPGDEEGLRRDLSQLVEDRKKRKRFGQLAEKRVKENFSAAEMARQYFKIYRNSMKGKGLDAC